MNDWKDDLTPEVRKRLESYKTKSSKADWKDDLTPEVRKRLDSYQVTEDLPPLFADVDGELLTPEKFSSNWVARGKDPNDRVKYLDEVPYNKRSNPNRTGKAYIQHRPTWLDRGKEFTQGVGAGVGNMADVASNYVASPLLFLGAKATGSLGENQISRNLKSLSDKYWNQNVSRDFKNANVLKTKNKDDTAAMLRGAGEFGLDILPANLVGKGVRLAAGASKAASKAASPAVKGFKNKLVNLWKEPKLPKVANILETPLTGKNATGFAGAGAGHEYINTDNWGDKLEGNDKPTWWMELPFMMGGAGLASGAYSGVKNAGKTLGKGIANNVKELYPNASDWLSKISDSPKELSKFQKKLANKIDKGDNTLDNKFISLAKENEIPLNAFNVYKDNPKPYEISRKNPSEGYLSLLPNMRRNIDDKIKKSLDENLGEYDNNTLAKDFSDNANKIADALRNRYSTIKDNVEMLYDDANIKSSYKDTVKPIGTIEAVTKLYKDTATPMKRGSGIGKLNKITEDLLLSFEGYTKEMPLKELLNQKRAIGQIMDSAPSEIGGLKSREIMLLKTINDAIDKDILYRSKIKDNSFLPSFQYANEYWKKEFLPLKQNKVFKNVKENLNVEDVIIKSLDDKNKSKDLLTQLKENALDNEFKNLPSKLAHKNYINSLGRNVTNTKLSEKEMEELFNSIRSNKKFKLADLEYSKNYKDPTIETLNKIKRLESEKRLITGESSNGKGVSKLIGEIQKTPFTSLYPDKVKDILQNVILPYANKHSDILAQNKKYKANLFNLSDKSDYYSNKYDITKHLYHWPMIMGSGVGAAAGSVTGIPSGNYIGGLIGAAVGGGYKYFKSKKIFNTMTDEKFVNELVRLGALPRESKKQVLYDLNERPYLKSEMIRLMFEKRDSEE